MRIVTLVENTNGACGCGTEHGLSFYIETAKHKLLFDAGASELVVKNAEALEVDLGAVDTVILSHGHSDHGGGLPYFMEKNSAAKIWLLPAMFEDHYSARGKNGPRYIGLPKEPVQHRDRLCFAKEREDVDGELSLFSGIGFAHPEPPTNAHLMMEGENGPVRDDFSHEQCLVITQGNKRFLFSGCAHHGILNVLDRYRELYGGEPAAVFGGFHMMRHDEPYRPEDRAFAEQTALALKEGNTAYFTCHCTGEEPYAWMKEILGERLSYLRCGDEMIL